MSTKMRRYVLYAFGEVALIIAGIMIALQIDNWNTDRQQQALLDSYLQSIARNIEADGVEIEQLSTLRRVRSIDAIRTSMIMGRQGYSYEIAEIFFFNKVANEAAQNLYFRSDSSGYESLKSSSVMSLMQGDDIERVLSRYYEQVELIADLERQQNETINQLNLQFIMSFPDEFPRWMFNTPRAMPPDQFAEMQPEYSRVINGSAIGQLISRQLLASLLVREYERLDALGKSFVRMVESGRNSFADPAGASLLDLNSSAEPQRYGNIVANGVLSTQYYNISGVADGFESVFDFRFIFPLDDSLRLSYPGSESWAAVFLQVWGLDDDRPHLDFSQFDKLVVELKSDSAADVVDLHIKDLFRPDDVAPDSVQLELTNNWKTYEIDLDRFPDTDLNSLITPLGFSFLKEPQSFYVRNARYVTSGPE